MKLAFFDFDGTLFRSPPAPPGRREDWWSEPTGLVPPCVPLRPGRAWWHEDTVRAARKAIRDRNVVAVLATGRPQQDGLPARVRQLLAGKGLHFDGVYLKPEADLSTTGWKQELLGELVERDPVTQVEIWEDRHLGELVDFIREALRLPVVPHHVWGHPHPCMTLVEPTSAPPGRRIYYEAILAPESRLLLWKWWEKCVGPLLEKGVAHHVTLAFIREHGDGDWPVGSKARYRVIGWAQDGEIQAVAVEPVGRAPMPLRQIPHVTVAMAPGVPPAKSNALLARGFKRVRGPTLDTMIGYYDGAHRISDLA